MGNFKMEYRDKTVNLIENKFVFVSKGVEHKPVAEEEVSLMVFEPATTLNTEEVEVCNGKVICFNELNKLEN